MNDDIISQHALRNAAEAIRMNLGDLSDLPLELANTYANIYYRAFAYEEHMRCGGRSRFLEPYISESNNIFNVHTDNVKFQAETVAALEHAKAVVQSLRQLRIDEPELFSHAVTTVLDVIKFNIENAESKTPIRRSLERKFKKVYEVPQLIDMMRKNGLRV
jgi:hypothetical protein